MNFGNYYKNKYLLPEMSLRFDAPDYSQLPKIASSKKWADFYKSESKFIETALINGEEFSVYIRNGRFYFISKEDVIAAIIEFTNKKEKGIQMNSIESSGLIKGFMPSLFIEYLLPKYHRIESDNIQTPQAFNLYKKLAEKSFKSKDFGMFLSDGKSLTEITSLEQMDKTYGFGSANYSYTYVLMKI